MPVQPDRPGAGAGRGFRRELDLDETRRRPQPRACGTDFEAWARIQPTTWASISPSIVHSSLNGPGGQELFNGYILRTRADLQFTRELFLRIVVQYDDFGSALSVGRSSPTGRTRSP